MTYDVESLLLGGPESRSNQFQGKSLYWSPDERKGTHVGVKLIHLLAIIIDPQVQRNVLGAKLRVAGLGNKLVFTG